MARFFDHVRLLENDSPLDNRFVAFNCSESYQVFPSGHQRQVILVNCGNGRNDWATVFESGYPGYGIFAPRAVACWLFSADVSTARSVALVMSYPAAARLS